jgi:hypothetical protein
MRLNALKLLAAIAVVAMSGIAASADDFFFSFSNVTGNVPGTVTGELFGLPDTSTGTASSVEILSFPSPLSAFFPTAPFDATQVICPSGCRPGPPTHFLSWAALL